MNIIKNDLFDYKNRYIFQPEKGFKFSLDSVLLSEYIKVKKSSDLIVDLCTGLAPIPLIISTKYKNKIIGFEIQKTIYDIATKNIELNELNNQIKIINDDIKNLGNYFLPKTIDIMTCNPPYFKYTDTSEVNNCEIEKISRHEVYIDLESIFKISSLFLKDNGILYLVHRPSRLDEIIILANLYNMNVKEIINIATNDNLDIKTILIKCVKNSKYDIKVKVINIKGMITYKNIFKEV